MVEEDDRPKGYSSIDRRKVDSRGRRRSPVTVPGKLDVSFADIAKPIDTSLKYFRAQIDHLPNPSGHSWPRSGEMRALLYGFVRSTEQLYRSTIIVMHDGAPRQFVLAGGVLARALIEGVGNLFALLDDPDHAPASFGRDDFLNTYLRIEFRKRRYGSDEAKEVKILRGYGEYLGLSVSEIEDPEGKKASQAALRRWPTPGKLLKRRQPPRLQGERRQVFRELCGFWYGSLSALSHHRVAALQMAFYTEEQPDERTFLMAKSAVATLAVVAVLCVLSEVEVALSIPGPPSLREAWALVRDVDELTQAVYDYRYQSLLDLPPRVSPPAPASEG
jgi:hypothetical protein